HEGAGVDARREVVNRVRAKLIGGVTADAGGQHNPCRGAREIGARLAERRQSGRAASVAAGPPAVVIKRGEAGLTADPRSCPEMGRLSILAALPQARACSGAGARRSAWVRSSCASGYGKQAAADGEASKRSASAD